MFESIIYIILALLALSFLIFIHELGHYWMARRVGMRVETFSIGFGKPVYSWMRDGVKWQIGWLIFGGFVKIAGQEPEDDRDPYEIEDGFFGKSPWARIKVAFAGPFMNLVLAIVLFGMLWAFGGRQKNFSEFTPKIGWVDPKSELYANGIRPGDEVIAYGDHEFQSSKDHVLSPLTASDTMDITINKVNYFTGEKTPGTYTVKVYQHPSSLESGIMTSGITQPASYVIYDKIGGKIDNPLPAGSSMIGSGIELGDRVVWVDGEVIFSLQQLNHILNDDRVLLTIERDGKRLLRRVPRVEAQELRMNTNYREELVDWQFEGDLNNIKLRDIYTLPYNLTTDNVVEEKMPFIDRDNEIDAFPEIINSEIEGPLLAGDRILAINGQSIEFPHQLLKLLQDRRVNIIVERGERSSKPISWDKANAAFDQEINWTALQSLVKNFTLGTSTKEVDELHLLKTVTPKRIIDLELSEEVQAMQALALSERKKMIEDIEDPVKRASALNRLENQQKQLILGLPAVQDKKVNYNPTPVELFSNIVQEIGRTLTALFSGTLNPKWMSGPVGIIHMVHDNSMVSIKESIFWIGLISLNLGVLNLLPIPVLDGGTIVFSLFEMITRRRIPPKTMEKFIIPFALLLVCFFIFLTYNDISRIFTKFF
ncbi:MAG: site-2 protease family protein [Chlamydiota bacterium]|nr:site-2 protease family protein [Chlamydiota bacterium]